MSDQDFESLRQSARANEPDRYLASLLSAAPVRGDLVALTAFAAELARIPKQISEPIAGELRIQWWHDALHAGQSGVLSGNPVADAFAEAARRHSLSLPLIDACLGAHAHRLYSAGPADHEALRMELDLTEGMLFRFAAHIGGAEDTDVSRSILADAAQAYGLARLGLDLPYALARGRYPLPPGDVVLEKRITGGLRAAVAELCRASRMHYKKVKSQISHVSPAMKSVLLPLALVEPYLGVLESSQHDPARDIAEISPVMRVWRIARARWGSSI